MNWRRSNSEKDQTEDEQKGHFIKTDFIEKFFSEGSVGNFIKIFLFSRPAIRYHGGKIRLASRSC